MSIGLRDQRCEIFAYADTGTDGIPATTYTRTGTWWCRVEPVSAREASIAANSDHQVDVNIVFAREATGLTTDGVIRHGTTIYKVNGVKPARMTGEQVVTAVYAASEVYDQVVTP